jgi:hypothetical protein
MKREEIIEKIAMTKTNLIDVTSHPLDMADLHILEPKNPFPPQTTSLLATGAAMVFK